ncbi:hypothetical protein [Nocardia testacea]|uniref:Uncharacterized protein n=1 Tax=Nocardia testacea TaxID=248551 RepID=A0ABW7VT97_9NOCA
MSRTRRTVMIAALVVPLALGFAVGEAAAAPVATPLPIPVVTGPEIGPGAVPGGVLQTIAVVGTTGEQQGTVTFSVPAPAPYHYQYNYRWITVHWRNLNTGAAGSIDLRHWTGIDVRGENYAAALPTSASVVTGGGPVVVTATHNREQYQAPPLSNAVIPGAGVVIAV